VGIVGRGEPLAVSRQLWERFCELLLEHEVFVAPVSNGSLLQDRIGPKLLPRLDALTISIDGATEETFARNRGGASLSNVLKNVAHFHEMRKASRLARAPRLGFSWTLKKNNIAEFPRFIEMIAELDADFVYARHLLTFFKRDAGESLVAASAFANPHLRKAYALMEKHGIRSDCPPILEDTPTEARGEAPASAPSKGCLFIWRTAVLLSDGEIPTCSAPFAAIAGHLRDKRFGSIWNGGVLRDVRQTLNGPGEWEQCRNCWYREGHYQEQRAQAAEGRAYDLQQAAQFTEKSWDFTDKEADLSQSLNRK
jgi:MoaA/NifB/PqqE/SkfB family radical SAM enzyme